MRWRRRRLLARAFVKRRQLMARTDRTGAIETGDILAFATMRNEMGRLPGFLDHYRRLGVDHFLIVDNGSDDGTDTCLSEQRDVSVWTTRRSYKAARFGMDWITRLLARHGHGHWCLTVDADELLVYAHHDRRDLRALTDWLDLTGRASMGAMMLDMYPRGALDRPDAAPDADPRTVLPWFDAGNYVMVRQPRLQNLWLQGGVRARCFFAADPRRAPTLSKVPLVRWNRRYAYVTSTHALLPRRLNHVYADEGGEAPTGVLLHTKFLPQIVQKSAEEKRRREHFENSDLYEAYYEALTEAPVLWCEASTRYQGWRQLEGLGLLSRGGWD
nr:glycosyltransferase family 2 protein [Jannaschia sp. S6380]